MSYNIELVGEKCPHCGVTPAEPDDCPDPTYNLAGIFHLALTGRRMNDPDISIFGEVILKEKVSAPRGLCVLSGKRAEETVADLQLAIQRLQDPSPASVTDFWLLEPDNGWGNVEDAIWVLDKLLWLASNYPKYTWKIR